MAHRRVHVGVWSGRTSERTNGIRWLHVGVDGNISVFLSFDRCAWWRRRWTVRAVKSANIGDLWLAATDVFDVVVSGQETARMSSGSNPPCRGCPLAAVVHFPGTGSTNSLLGDRCTTTRGRCVYTPRCPQGTTLLCRCGLRCSHKVRIVLLPCEAPL